MAVCVAFKNISKRYGKTLAVDDLSLEVETGEIFGLLGPNGAGKTTTLDMLAGLVRPNEGTITAFGRDVRRGFLEIAGRRGVLAEKPAFYDKLTVENNLRIQARLAGCELNLKRVLHIAGIVHVADTKAGHLSQGMRRRLGLAQAMMTEPELLVLDEPTSGLDIESTQEILQLLRRLADEAKVTVVISSHQLGEVEQLCDRVAVINQGKLLSCEKTGNLLSYDMKNIEIIVEGAEAAARRLTEQKWVVHTEVSSGRLFVRLAESSPHQLVAFLINSGYQVSAVIPRRRTLRDYFLRVLNPDNQEPIERGES